MSRLLFPPHAAIIIGILLVAAFGYSLVSVAHSNSSDTAWQLTVTGLVDHPLNLTYADLSVMPQTTIYAQLICVGPPSFAVTEGNWTGVRLWLLLQEARVSNGTIKIAFYAQDGFTTDLTMGTAKRDDVILAYEKDGVPLSEGLRLVVPESWGYKWISQVIKIELVDYNFLGFYESRGYPDNGTDMPNIIPDAPKILIPTVYLPSPSLSPTPSNSSNSGPPQSQNPTSASPPNAPAPSQQPKPPAEIEQAVFLPIEFFYATVATIFIVIIIAAFAIRKHQQRFN